LTRVLVIAANTTVANKPIIVMTTITSIRVKPLVFFDWENVMIVDFIIPVKNSVITYSGEYFRSKNAKHVYYKYIITIDMDHNFKINEDDTFLKNRPKKLPGGIIGWLLKFKIVSTAGQANVLLLFFIIIGMSAIIYFNWRTFGG
jgi:hypothetical protein